MTNEQINIKIAELCGWKQVHKPGLSGLVIGKAPRGYVGDKTHYQIEPADDWCEIPDYIADLNACHEFEKTLAHELAELYDDELCDICAKVNELLDNPKPWRFAVSTATASQRCEAFLRVHGQWED